MFGMGMGGGMMGGLAGRTGGIAGGGMGAAGQMGVNINSPFSPEMIQPDPAEMDPYAPMNQPAASVTPGFEPRGIPAVGQPSQMGGPAAAPPGQRVPGRWNRLQEAYRRAAGKMQQAQGAAGGGGRMANRGVQQTPYVPARQY